MRKHRSRSTFSKILHALTYAFNAVFGLLLFIVGLEWLASSVSQPVLGIIPDQAYEPLLYVGGAVVAFFLSRVTKQLATTQDDHINTEQPDPNSVLEDSLSETFVFRKPLFLKKQPDPTPISAKSSAADLEVALCNVLDHAMYLIEGPAFIEGPGSRDTIALSLASDHVRDLAFSLDRASKLLRASDRTGTTTSDFSRASEQASTIASDLSIAINCINNPLYLKYRDPNLAIRRAIHLYTRVTRIVTRELGSEHPQVIHYHKHIAVLGEKLKEANKRKQQQE